MYQVNGIKMHLRTHIIRILEQVFQQLYNMSFCVLFILLHAEWYL